MIIYFLTSFIDGYKKLEPNTQILIASPILYLGGRIVGIKTPTIISALKLFWIVGIFLASMPLISISIDVLQHGFLGGSRSISISDSEQEISATVLGGMLIIPAAYAGLLFSPTSTIRLHEKTIIIIFFTLTLFSATRIGSRTILIIGTVSAIQGIYMNRKKLGLFYTISSCTAILIILYLLINYLSEAFDIFSYYQDRMGSEEYGVGSAGGRTEKWIASFQLMLDKPMGWSIDENGYSHNLWLDIGRNGGAIAFAASIILTTRAIKDFKKTLAKHHRETTYTTLIVCTGTAYTIIFFIEPIFDGFVYTFASFCCLWGLINGISLSNPPINYIKHKPQT